MPSVNPRRRPMLPLKRPRQAVAPARADSGTAAHPTAGWLKRAAALARRLPRVAYEEARFDPRGVFCGVLSTAFPRATFNRTRTALLRRAGLSVGPQSLVMGPIRFTGPGDVR